MAAGITARVGRRASEAVLHKAGTAWLKADPSCRRSGSRISSRPIRRSWGWATWNCALRSASTRAGRLDLLLQDPDTMRRYEVELQLGTTDEAHIIRTIEYWDIERKRYPRYEHCAVLVAKDVTSGFLNVISSSTGRYHSLPFRCRRSRSRAHHSRLRHRRRRVNPRIGG